MSISSAQTDRHSQDSSFDPVMAAQSVLPILREVSANGEEIRKADDRAMRAMKTAGLARILSPKSIGGYEMSPSAHIQSCRVTAHGCSAASWVHMVCGAHTYVLGRYAEQCQEEVFDGDPDIRIPGTLAPQGQAHKVDGGWCLNGRWQFGSGIDHGDWLLFGAKGVAVNGQEPMPPIHVFVPKSDIFVDDTWFTLGMRGTGSKDLVAEDVFVPEHRALPTGQVFSGKVPGDVGPLYRLPVAAGLANMLAGTVLGMTERGIENFIEITKVRTDAYFGGSKASKPGIQMRLAEALGEVELAAMLIDKSCTLFDEAMVAKALPMSTEQRAQLRWNASYAVELCRRATDRVFAVAGAHAIYNKSELQRWHRDVNTACQHAIADYDSIAQARGKLALGLEVGPAEV